MIREIRRFQDYQPFIDRVSGDERFQDPHFAHDRNDLYGAVGAENKRAWAVAEGGRVLGIFSWLILPGYLELLVGLSECERGYREMLEWMEGAYPGCRMDFVIAPQNRLFRRILEERGAAFEKEQVKMVWRARTDLPSRPTVIRLTPEWETRYRMLHNDADVYWTAERVLAASDRFRVFLALQGEVAVGYLDVTYGKTENEIYALWIDRAFAGQGYEQALLAAALSANGSSGMMALVDADAREEIEIYRRAGFAVAEGQNTLFASYHT